MNPNLRVTFNDVIANLDDRDNLIIGKSVVINDENAEIYDAVSGGFLMCCYI